LGLRAVGSLVFVGVVGAFFASLRVGDFVAPATPEQNLKTWAYNQQAAKREQLVDSATKSGQH
jgi:hypothetical protein